MKVLGIVGSRRKSGNTSRLVERALEACVQGGAETQSIYLSDYKYIGCTGCEGCRKTYKCVIQDGMQEIYTALESADAIVLGSPTYFYNVTADVKAFIERLYCQEIFHEADRSVWTSMNEVLGGKYAVSIAVCEQEDERDMGVTSKVMDMSLAALGYRVVDSVKALRLYEKNDVLENEVYLDQAYKAGLKLVRSLELRSSVLGVLKG